jgi:hypothetical protein
LPESYRYFFVRGLGKILRRIVLRRKVLRSDDSSLESYRYFFVMPKNSLPENSLPKSSLLKLFLEEQKIFR